MSKIEINLDRCSRGYQVSLNVTNEDGCGHGLRLLGPKYAGDSELIAKRTLNQYDIKNIRALLEGN